MEGLSGGNQVNGSKPHHDLELEWGILHAIEGVLSSIQLKASNCRSNEQVLEALGHHVIILRSPGLIPCTPLLAKVFTAKLEHGFVDAPITLDKVDGLIGGIHKAGDAHHSLIPAHDAASIAEVPDE